MCDGSRHCSYIFQERCGELDLISMHTGLTDHRSCQADAGSLSVCWSIQVADSFTLSASLTHFVHPHTNPQAFSNPFLRPSTPCTFSSPPKYVIHNSSPTSISLSAVKTQLLPLRSFRTFGSQE